MITFAQHKVAVLTSIFNKLSDNGKTNPCLYITNEEYKNVILPIPSDLMQIDALRPKTDEILRYITKSAKTLHVSFVSEVNKVQVDSADLTSEEEKMIRNKRISPELRNKLDNARVDGLIVHSFSKEKGSVEKEFMVFEKKNGTFIPDKMANQAMKDGTAPEDRENRFVDILE